MIGSVTDLSDLIAYLPRGLNTGKIFMKSEIKTQNISTKKLKFVAEIFLADLRGYFNEKDIRKKEQTLRLAINLV